MLSRSRAAPAIEADAGSSDTSHVTASLTTPADRPLRFGFAEAARRRLSAKSDSLLVGYPNRLTHNRFGWLELYPKHAVLEFR